MLEWVLQSDRFSVILQVYDAKQTRPSPVLREGVATPDYLFPGCQIVRPEAADSVHRPIKLFDLQEL